ncbi:MAG: hypothetical protein HY784_16815 [Chloroflexi bacterium]|nr:hypothetical protein [Chloroflexota bacterium]
MSTEAAGQSGGINIDQVGAVSVARDMAGRDIIYNVQGVDLAVLRALEAELNDFLARFVVLHRQLEEWKDLHNVLQDLQVRFSICRSYGLELGRRDDRRGGLLGILGRNAGRDEQSERSLYELSLNWQQCKLTVDQLRRFTAGLRLLFEQGQMLGDDLSVGEHYAPP